MMNDIFPFMTFNETIQLMQSMADKMPRNRSSPHPTGLYIETKHYQYYKEHYGLDFAEILYEHLKAFSLESVDKSIENKIPIIIECFEPEALKKFGELSDLPLILLMDDEMLMAKDMDVDTIASYAHGVGPVGSGLYIKNFMA